MYEVRMPVFCMQVKKYLDVIKEVEILPPMDPNGCLLVALLH
jgi:hypothetical protein